MKNYYAVKANTLPEEYVTIDENSVYFVFQNACFESEFQHLYPNETTIISVDENSGDIIPDLLSYQGTGIVIISDQFKKILDDFGVMEYVFFSKVILRRESTGEDYPCWLMIPPKIECLDYSKSKILESSIPILRKAVIDWRKTGRYDMFKIEGENGLALSQLIIISESLAEHIKSAQNNGVTLKNVFITKL